MHHLFSDSENEVKLKHVYAPYLKHHRYQAELSTPDLYSISVNVIGSFLQEFMIQKKLYQLHYKKNEEVTPEKNEIYLIFITIP